MEAVRKMQAAAEDHIADLGWQRLFSLFDTDGNGNLDKDGARLSSCSELVALRSTSVFNFWNFPFLSAAVR
jgi:hypothetical protein